MIKRTAVIILVICLTLISLLDVVYAQDKIKVLDNSVEVDFPLILDFSLSVEGNTDITDIRLHYSIDRKSFVDVTGEVYVNFLPAKTVDVSWSWDMRRTGGLPPGAKVVYWWTVMDRDKNRVETKPIQVKFDDTRHNWYNITEGEVTIYWYKGEESFAEEIATTVRESLARLADDTGAYLEDPVDIFIYGSSEALRGAMVFPQEWTGGVAYTRYSTIAIGIAPSNLTWGKRAITHELTHLVIHQMTLNPYIDLPTWLDEGLAMYSEGELDPTSLVSLRNAVERDRLISVRSLASPFSAFTGQSQLSYAQSYSLVEFLVTKYGRSKMLELLNTFKEGSGYDDALMKVYGFDMDGLDVLWRGYITGESQTAEKPGGIPVSTGMWC